jgi:nitrous oxidase accessory protein
MMRTCLFFEYGFPQIIKEVKTSRYWGNTLSKRATGIILMLMFLAIIATQFTKPSEASSKTIMVPDDYPSITAAIGNATNGDTVFVREGTYSEPSLVINKTILLLGENANTTIIKNIDRSALQDNDLFPSLPIVVQINANNVKISGFTVSGSYGTPISVNSNGSEVSGNTIDPKGEGISISGNYNKFMQNNLSGLGGGFISCSGLYNEIANNHLKGQTDGGIDIGSPFNIVYGNTLTNCGVYGSIKVRSNETIIAENNMTNSGGIAIEQGSNNLVYSNIIIGSGFGVVGYNNTLYANYATFSVILGNGAYDGANNTFFGNNFVGSTQVGIWYGVRGPNFWDNGKEGNYWKDYNGTDANGDGIGDTPYLINICSGDGLPLPKSSEYIDHYPLMAPFDISSVVVQLPEWASLASKPTPSLLSTFRPPASPLSTQAPNSSLSDSPSYLPSNSLNQASDDSSLYTNAYVIGLVAIVVVISLITVAVVFRRKKQKPNINKT